MLKTSALKRIAIITVALAGMAQAAPALPADPRFDQPVTVAMVPGGIELETLLRGLAASVRLNLVAEGIPNKKVAYELTGKPFRQVWELIVALNGLDFEVQPNDVVLVGPPNVVSLVRRPTPAPVPAPATPAPVERRFYTVKSDVAAIQAFLSRELPGVTVNTVAGSRVISVNGTAAQQREVEALLAQVDLPPAAPTVAPAPPPPTERRFYTVKSDIGTIQATLTRELKGIGVDAVEGSRVIVISGTAAQQQDAQALLAQVDVAPPAASPTRLERRVFRLSNTDAVRLAKVLQEAVAGPAAAATNVSVTNPSPTGAGTTTTTTLPGGATASDGQAAPVTITADEGSNALIVSGTPAQIETIAQLIPQLDQRQQLVNVNVRIQEVSDSAGRNLGIDWSFGIGNFAGKVLTGGLSFLFDATRSLAGLNIGAALNALESQRLSKRINDTTVTVLNNGTGRVNSGGRIEVSLPGTGGNNISKTLEYGVIVNVKPVVSADGTITLSLNAEISDLLNKGNLNPNRIDFDRSASSTTVRLQSGQTVLLGSLLQTRTDETVSGVPVLSAIPLIGELFKNRATSDEQRQLLIVVTADLIK